MEKQTFKQLKDKIKMKNQKISDKEKNELKSSFNPFSKNFVGCSELIDSKKFNKVKNTALKVTSGAVAMLSLLSATEAIETHIENKNKNSIVPGTTISEFGVMGTQDKLDNMITEPTKYDYDKLAEQLLTTTSPQTTTSPSTTLAESTTKVETTTKAESTTQAETTTQAESTTEEQTTETQTTKPYEPQTKPNGEIDRTMKVMSFNLEMHYLPTVIAGKTKTKDGRVVTEEQAALYKWDNRKEMVLEEVQKADADIICFQEITPTMNAYLKENMPEYTVSYFYRRNSDKTSFSSAFYFRTDRFEELDWGKFWLSPTPDVESNCWDGDIRTCAWEVLRDKNTGKEFCVMNTHYTLRSREAMNNSSALINQKTEEMGLPTIIMGDFNSNTTYDCYQTTTEVFDDASVVAKDIVDEGPTFGGYDIESHGHKKPIDFIFVTKKDNWRVLSYELCDDFMENYYSEYGEYFSEQADKPSSPSDHFAITAEVELRD